MKITWFIDSYGRVRVMEGKYDLDKIINLNEVLKNELFLIDDEKEEERFFTNFNYKKEEGFFFLCDEWGNEEVTDEFINSFLTKKEEKRMYVITKWCKSITESEKDEYTHREVPKEYIYKFRLLDDDGIIYAYGMASSNNDEKAFRPLDEIGRSYGCTEIQYKNPDTGEYETL